MKKPITLSLMILVAGTLACSSLIKPTPTLTPTSTFTFTPSPIPTVTASMMPAPTDTAIPTEPANVIAGLVPVGEPESEWNGIPIMPGAIAGDGDTGAYRSMIKASQDEIQEYYERELRKLGWSLLATGQGDTGVVILIFTGDSGTLSVSLIEHDDEYIVMIVK